MVKVGRYSLKIYIESLNKTYTIKLYENNQLKEKVSLQTIDDYTINNSFINIVSSLNIDTSNLKENNRIYIAYQANGNEKHLKAIFNNTYSLKYFAHQKVKNIDLNDERFVYFIDHILLPFLTKCDGYNFLRGYHYLDYKLDEWMKNYLTNVIREEFCIQKIYEYASNYMQLRNLILGIELYKKLKYDQELDKTLKAIPKKEIYSRPYYDTYALSEIDKFDEPDQGLALFTEEEIKKYRLIIDPDLKEIEKSNNNDKTLIKKM